MKFVLFSLLIISAISCSSTETVNREISSVENNCKLEKHKTKDWYRFKMNDHAYNKHWYKKNEAEEIYNNFYSSGRCKN